MRFPRDSGAHDRLLSARARIDRARVHAASVIGNFFFCVELVENIKSAFDCPSKSRLPKRARNNLGCTFYSVDTWNYLIIRCLIIIVNISGRDLVRYAPVTRTSEKIGRTGVARGERFWWWWVDGFTRRLFVISFFIPFVFRHVTILRVLRFSPPPFDSFASDFCKQ